MQEDLEAQVEAAERTEGPATGGPNPGAELEALRRKLAELEADNAKLRAERRLEKTAQLVDQLGLSARQALELAQIGSLEEIERKAHEFAQANASKPAAPPAETLAAPTSAAPDAGLASLEGAGEAGPSLEAPAASWQEEMQRRIAKATSLAEVKAIQEEYLRRMG